MLRHIITTLLKTKDDTDTLEDGLTVSYETKSILTIQHSNSAPQYLPK